MSTDDSFAQTFDPHRWMDDLSAAMRKRFGGRLLFLGLQGSCRRGEAGPNSDIDAVVILDRLDLQDLAAYRAVLDAMPHRERSCGFISGQAELAAWPRHELFQFLHDTMAWHGDLASLMPALGRDDVEKGVWIAASGLYHMACHTFVHGGDGWEEALRGMYKAAFFPIQAAYFARTGDYVEKKRDLLERLDGREREIVRLGLEWPEGAGAERERLFGLLVDWSGEALVKGGGHGGK